MTSESSATALSLSNTEVCDVCPARAQVLATKKIDGDTLSLVFCLHHASRYLAELVLQDFSVNLEENNVVPSPVCVA